MKTLTELRKTSFSAPADVRKAAAKGLELREEFGRGGLSIQQASEQGIGSGVARARDLVKGKVSFDTIKRMKSYFARHAIDSQAKGSDSRGYWGQESNPSAGYVAWLLWGGNPAKRWVNAILKDVEE